jgi:acetoin utilization protein AcuA
VLSFLLSNFERSSESAARHIETRRGRVAIIPSCSFQVMQALGIDEGLGFFWHNRPDLQREALLRIAAEPSGRVTIAHNADQKIIGYVTITPPDEDTRWGRDHIDGLLELGGIEVARAWRGLRLSDALLKATFDGGAFEPSIVIATGYRWCWDMESTGLTVREYREMLNRVFERYAFKFLETDEPNIAWYPDNALVARVGSRTSEKLQAQFKALLFERLGSDYAPSEFLR